VIFFRYRRYLEQQIEEQKLEIRRLQSREEELIRALVPVLRRMGETSVQARDIVEKKKEHKLKHDETTAECVCGWAFESQDPAELQTEIAKHHREIVNGLRGKRMGWVQIKTKLEEGVSA
jgi:hypothetical protein